MKIYNSAFFSSSGDSPHEDQFSIKHFLCLPSHYRIEAIQKLDCIMQIQSMFSSRWFLLNFTVFLSIGSDNNDLSKVLYSTCSNRLPFDQQLCIPFSCKEKKNQCPKRERELTHHQFNTHNMDKCAAADFDGSQAKMWPQRLEAGSVIHTLLFFYYYWYTAMEKRNILHSIKNVILQ